MALSLAGVRFLPPRQIWRRYLLALQIMLIAPAPAAAQTAKTIELRFGTTVVTLDRALVLSVGNVSITPGLTQTQFTVSSDGSVAIKVPTELLNSFSPPCEPVVDAVLESATVPSIKRQSLFAGLQTTEKLTGNISRLQFPSKRTVLNLYEYDAPDLKDFWGEQIAFFQTGRLVRVDVQVTRELRLVFSTSARECFFDRSEVFVRNLRSFILSKIKEGER